MTIAAGTRFGPYEIQAPLGAGGMGEVYCARDTRLGREVAIKALPEAVADDRERLARFEREAQVLASLNHPAVAAIYGLEEIGSRRYIVMELVPGDTLADRLAAGPLGLEAALVICRQVADALEAAHEKGIVHRDLKPANVKVTPDEAVKVLDFGLAKAFRSEAAPADPSQSPPTFSGSHEGLIVGTARYMSPEQARGAPVDRRTDIWSFGCLLYEMLTGRQAFAAPTFSDTIAAILDREPDLAALPADTPRTVRQLVRRCLEKNVRRRLHDIADARIEIDDALAQLRTGATEAPVPVSVTTGGRAGLWGRRSLVLAALVGAIGGGLIVWLALRAEPRAATGAITITEVARVTHDPGLAEWPTWSPDGSLLAFASNRSGNFEIYVRRVEGGQEVNVTNDPADDFQPAFSPDGKSLAFVSTRSARTSTVKIAATFGFEFRTFGGDIWVAPVLGGRARRLAQDGNFPTWHPDGKQIAYVSGPEGHRSILTVAAEGSGSRFLLSADASSWEIVRLQHSPDGSWIGFDTVIPERVFLLPSAGGQPRQVLSGSSHVWHPPGERLSYFTRDPAGGTRLQSIGIDKASGAPLDAPRTVGLMTGMLRDLAISADGRRFAASELEGSLNLTRLPLTKAGDGPGGAEEVLSSGQVIDRYPSYSPDGRRIAFASDRLGREEIWILDLETRRQERLQIPGSDLGVNLPYWLPDGQRLTVTRFYQDGNRSLWLVAMDGSHAEELRPPTLGLAGSPISPDGALVLFSATTDRVLQLFTLDLSSRQVRQLTTSAGDKFTADWSPDGRWIVYVSNAGGPLQLWRMPAGGGEAQRLTSGNDRIRHSFFSPDGRWLYFQPNHQNIYRMPAAGGAPQKVTRFPDSALFMEEPSLSPDGRYLLYCRSQGGASLWVLTTGDSTPRSR